MRLLKILIFLFFENFLKTQRVPLQFFFEILQQNGFSKISKGPLLQFSALWEISKWIIFVLKLGFLRPSTLYPNFVFLKTGVFSMLLFLGVGKNFRLLMQSCCFFFFSRPFHENFKFLKNCPYDFYEILHSHSTPKGAPACAEASKSYGWDVINIAKISPKMAKKQPFFDIFRFSQKLSIRFERNFLQIFYTILESYMCNGIKIVWLGCEKHSQN